MKTIHLRHLLFYELRSLLIAILVAAIATCYLFFSTALFSLLIPIGEKVSVIIAYSVYNLIIAVGCYFLCQKNPDSVWFVPLICNATGIVSAFIDPNFWVTSIWILTVFGWMISLTASIWGYDVGRKMKRKEYQIH